MKFYIVTPSFNSMQWLPRCIRSVADQVRDGLEVHHHVQDGGSKDGLPDWLQQWRDSHQGIPGYTFTFESGKDKGMYDAINLAWEKLPENADMTAHINSDEQYAPGALAAVAEHMARHPKADILLGAYIIMDAHGRYICHRRPVKPCKLGSRLTCELMTCATFHRADPFRKHGVRFDTRYRSLADLVFYRDIVARSPKVISTPSLITSFFTVTGDNLAWQSISAKEWEQYRKTGLTPFLSKHYLWAVRRVNGMRRLVDFFCPAPRSFSL